MLLQVPCKDLENPRLYKLFSEYAKYLCNRSRLSTKNKSMKLIQKQVPTLKDE